MSGDVFGNGMLLSEHIKLVAAFDHRHVFLDPDPDPAASFKERSRMFALPRSSWADYDPALISPGGGVWPRTGRSRARWRLAAIMFSSLWPRVESLMRAKPALDCGSSSYRLRVRCMRQKREGWTKKGGSCGYRSPRRFAQVLMKTRVK